MITFSFKSDIDEARKKLIGMSAQIDSAAARALNRVATTARAEIAERAGETAGESDRARKQLKKKLTLYRASKNKLTAELVGRGKLSLSFFLPRQTPSGVSYSVGGKTRHITGAFIERIYGARAAWRRKYRGPGSTAKSRAAVGKELAGRFPVRKLYGPYVSDLMSLPAIADAARRVIGERWAVEMRRELDNILRRK